MAAKVLNIEIGKRITKVCVSEKKGKSFAITDEFIFATPEGAAVDGQIVSEITLGDALKEQLADRNIVANEAYFTIASTKIASRDVSLPNAKEDQIKNIVATNASDYFPIDIEKYTIDTVLLEKTENECRALVVAVPTAIVESYIALAEYMGISIGALDYCANSQYQVLKAIGGENVDMFINVDADATSIIFTENGKLLMQRSISVGGDELISRYMALKEMPEYLYLKALGELSAGNGSAAAEGAEESAETPAAEPETEEGADAAEEFAEADSDEEAEESAEIEDAEEDADETAEETAEEDAEEATVDSEESIDIFSGASDDDEEESDFDILDDVGYNSCLTRLVNTIARSLDYFRNGSFGDKEIGRVILMGTCCHMAGLKEKIAEALGTETLCLEEVPDLQTLANSIGDISIYVGCLGSRLAPMNFLPSEYVKKHGKKNGTINGDNFGIVAIVAAVLIAAILCGIPGIKGIIANKKLEDIESQIDEIKDAEDKYNEYVRYQSGRDNLKAYVDGSITNNENLKAFFEELEKKMPSNIVVLSASCTTESVSLNVTVTSFAEAAETLRQLRTFASIDVVDCSAMSKSGDDGASLVSFSINCSYPVPEPEPVVEEVVEETEAEE